MEEWPWQTSPDYLLGPSVLIPGKTITPLLAAAQTTPYYHIDDLYLTGLCNQKANIKLRSFNRFYDNRYIEDRYFEFRFLLFFVFY